jgi:hypothetical protein
VQGSKISFRIQHMGFSKDTKVIMLLTVIKSMMPCTEMIAGHGPASAQAMEHTAACNKARTA